MEGSFLAMPAAIDAPYITLPLHTHAAGEVPSDRPLHAQTSCATCRPMQSPTYQSSSFHDAHAARKGLVPTNYALCQTPPSFANTPTLLAHSDPPPAPPGRD
jgi:hypothetical protein